MHHYRLWIELEDRSGQLAAAAATLARVGGNIEAVDVHVLDGDRVADELVVGLPAPVDLPWFEDLFRGGACLVLDARPCDVHQLVDRATRALELVHSASLAGGCVGSIEAAACELVGADAATTATSGRNLAGVAGRAWSDHTPVQGQEAVAGLVSGHDEPPWVLALPYEMVGHPHLLVLVRRRPRFSYTETARVQALVRSMVAVGGERPHPGGSARNGAVGLADGGVLHLRLARPTDGSALRRLYDRCSRSTRLRRWSTAKTDAQREVLGELIDGRSRLVLLATIGSEIVGVADGHIAAQTMQLNVVVEDGHQRRGIGTLLVTELLQMATTRGATHLAAECPPDQPVLPRLLGNLGYEVHTTFTDGRLHVSASAPTRQRETRSA